MASQTAGRARTIQARAAAGQTWSGLARFARDAPLRRLGALRLIDERGQALAKTRQASFERARQDATYAWDASPISTARLCGLSLLGIGGRLETSMSCVGPSSFLSVSVARMYSMIELSHPTYIGQSPLPKGPVPLGWA